MTLNLEKLTFYIVVVICENVRIVFLAISYGQLMSPLLGMGAYRWYGSIAYHGSWQCFKCFNEKLYTTGTSIFNHISNTNLNIMSCHINYECAWCMNWWNWFINGALWTMNNSFSCRCFFYVLICFFSLMEKKKKTQTCGKRGNK